MNTVSKLAMMCSHYIETGVCSDLCPVWRLLNGDCFPCNVCGEKWPEVERLVEQWYELFTKE